MRNLLDRRLASPSIATLCADGVVGVDFDYEVLGEKNGMMMVAVGGTAVKMA